MYSREGGKLVDPPYGQLAVSPLQYVVYVHDTSLTRKAGLPQGHSTGRAGSKWASHRSRVLLQARQRNFWKLPNTPVYMSLPPIPQL
jgi:hypothetical protein